MAKRIYIALAGNPNCGKTTLFNEITGSNGYVGNWPGVTVEKKEALWRKDKSVVLTDLPGIYSLSPYSPEEIVSRDYLIEGKPEAVINLVDATNLERNLYLTTQVLECGIPTVVGLNMSDLLAKRGDQVNLELLSKKLGVSVLSVSALHNKNIEELCTKAKELAEGGSWKPLHLFSEDVEEALAQIAEIIKEHTTEQTSRWYSVKVFERDSEAVKALELSEDELSACEAIIQKLEEKLEDDSESIIVAGRYDWIAEVISECVVKVPAKLSTTEKIDRIVTNRILGLPIFIIIMTLVYCLATSSEGFGTKATDFVNDNIFGDGFYLDDGIGFVFTGQGEHMDAYTEAKEEFESHNYQAQIDAFLEKAEEDGVETKGVKDAISAEEPTPEDKEIIAHFEEEAKKHNVVVKKLPLRDADGNFLDTEGEPVVAKIVNGEDVPELGDGQELLTVSVNTEAFIEAVEATEPDPSEFGHWINGIPVVVTQALEDMGASEMVISLVVDGIITGVGAVLGFLPQMTVLFVFLTFLEDCGYMSRVAFVMDRIFRKFGLSGKSFIPLLVSAGCAVPGVMSTKTIENEADRRMTIMTTPFVPCSAKLPIIALLMGVLIGGPDAWWVAPSFYFMGVGAVIISGIMLKKTKIFAGDPTPFIMELPAYHLPRLKSYLLHIWERARAFVMKAGSIIFIAAIAVWILSNFGYAQWDGLSVFGYLPGIEGAPENVMDYSILARFGEAVKFVFAPLGFANWQAVAATVSGLVAKENLVSTYAVLYGLGEVGENSSVLWSMVNNTFAVDGVINYGGIVAFMSFNLLCAPCFAAMGAMKKQLDDRKWWLIAISFETVFAWVIALFINQFYQLSVHGVFGVWTVVAFVLAGAMFFQLFRPTPKYESKEKTKEEDAS